MGDCDILLLVVVLASCSTPTPGRSNLLPPTADAAAGGSPTRRPGDPQAADSGPEGDDVAAAADAGPAPAGPDAAQPAAPDTGPPAAPDAGPSLAPDAAELPADAAPRGDVGVTWDANLILTDCGITKPWAPKKSYPKNDFALNYGHIFQCIGEPPNQTLPSPWSDCKSPDYEPGKPGGPWAQAWYDSGICRP